jgi:energy-coupling factor transporter ATP-binding protein EcfA2
LIVATERVQRWMLSRAGIVNVYQYGNEILQFADGRLLLRGVNGSGKSTAMNMLLPFLLDADTRRIDAAQTARRIRSRPGGSSRRAVRASIFVSWRTGCR